MQMNNRPRIPKGKVEIQFRCLLKGEPSAATWRLSRRKRTNGKRSRSRPSPLPLCKLPKGTAKGCQPSPSWAKLAYLLMYNNWTTLMPTRNGTAEKVRLLRDTCSFSLFQTPTQIFLLLLQLNYVVQCKNISKVNPTASKKHTTKRSNSYTSREKRPINAWNFMNWP